MTDPGSMPRVAEAFTTIQFQIPKTVARKLDSMAIRERAQATGVNDTSFEMSTVSRPPLHARITCDRIVAGYIVDACTKLAAQSSGQLLIAAAAAAMAGLNVMTPRARRDS